MIGKHSRAVRSFLAVAASGIAFVLIAMLIKPVLIDGEIISYWMGNWNPVSGYAIGIGYEVDQLGMFFALLVVSTILLSAVYSIRYMENDSSQEFYYVLFLMLSGSVLGLVMTGDVFNMFIMIEIMTFTAAALTAFRNKEAVAIEAGFKYLVLRFSTWNHSEFNCKFDGVVYAVAVSLGFAVWENIQYVFSYGLSTALVRAVTAVPGHACFGVLMGAWYGLAKRKQAQEWGNASFLARLLAVIIPTIVHGAYDFVATSTMDTIHFVMFVVIMFIVCFFTVKKLSADDKYHNDEGNYGI